MCGIALVLEPCPDTACNTVAEVCPEASDGLVSKAMLSRRGPDYYGEHKVQAQGKNGQALQLQFVASLLQLRGSTPSAAPLCHSISGDCLCFNGELFGGLYVAPGCNDGQVLLDALAQSSDADVPRLLSSLRGPWSLIFWRQSTSTVWFGRDFMGRRSLLVHYPRINSGDNQFILSSVAPPGSTTIVAAPTAQGQVNQAESLPVETDSSLQADMPVRHGAGGEDGEDEGGDAQDPTAFWQELLPGIYSLQLSCDGDVDAASSREAQDATAQSSLPASAIPPTATAWFDAQGMVLQAHGWQDAPIQRLYSYPKVPSGCLDMARQDQASEQIGPAGVEALEATQSQDGGAVGCDEEEQGHCDRIPAALGVCWTLETAVDSLLAALQAAVAVRCRCVDSLQVPGSMEQQYPAGVQISGVAEASTSMPVMVLFSGGVDSVLLAAMAHRSLPADCQLDLCNVCFDGGRSPDRIAARLAVAELAQWAPERKWRLIEVDGTLEETYVHREHLLALLHPAGTIMDLNIGAALWLAASGEGRLYFPPSTSQTDGQDTLASTGEPSTSTYCSPARVVLLGHGADEQCAGYGRHRTRFRHGGLPALAGELSMDVRRMWLRNCGRDDRLIADRSREARHPFLDEQLMTLLLDIPLGCIADLSKPPGVGDKILLRQSLLKLGLGQAASRVKRAIQFGSRIGKLSNRREFGSNRAANRVNAGSLALSKLPKAANSTASAQCRTP